MRNGGGFEPSRRSAEHGFESSRRSAEYGFTLVELLVALLIFGMLAAAGVGLLRFSVDAQAATKTRLDALAADRRIEALLASDAAQAVPRPSRDAAGATVRAFEGGPTGFTLVRGGVDPLSEGVRPALQKVQVRFEGGALARRAYPMLDGAEPGPPAILSAQIRQARFRYRSRDGWRDFWDAISTAAMPRAIELVLTPVRGPQMRYVFLVGAGA